MKKPPQVIPVVVHPHTLKYLKKGHPWVTKDTYTIDFPKQAFLVRPKLTENNGHFLLLHDPNHQQVKARLWKFHPGQWVGYTQGAMIYDLKERLYSAILKRIDLKIPEERQNWYWAFGEADQLPGLHILILGEVIWVQFYAHYWAKLQKDLVILIHQIMKEMVKKEWLKTPKFLALQLRLESVEEKKSPLKIMHWQTWQPVKEQIHWNVQEGPIHFKLSMGDRYDLGIYTDMAQVRKQLDPALVKGKKVLNLFCYTGAFSLWALYHGAQEVYSVDLSTWALECLEENLELNIKMNSLTAEHKLQHHTWRVTAAAAILNFKQKNELVDLIICDPPAISSDGRKKQTASAFYKKMIPDMRNILSKKGSLLLMSNVHGTVKSSWDKGMRPYLKLSGDCPIMSAFPEGDYLKVYKLGHES